MEKLRILSSYFKTKLGGAKRFRSREELMAWQDKKVRAFLKKTTAKSAFYRDYYEGYDLSDWRSLPPIDKAIMMENFDKLNTIGIGKAEALELALKAETDRDFSPMIGDITIGLSSGTSGNRGVFLVSPQERNAWAGVILAKMLPRPIWAEHKVAFFLRANSNLYETVQSGRIRFEYFDLLDPLEQHVERLERFSPSILIAPPSMLRLLAKAKQYGHLAIRPEKIVSVAEVLDPLDEALISRQFEQRVHQVYQCTEGFLAVTCQHGRLHINEDILAVQCEFLEGSTRKFMPVITDFSRTSQPIIRYRLNDILTLAEEPCPCGSAHLALEAIEGRCDDMFYFAKRGGGQEVPVFPDFIRRAIMAASDEIEEYKAIQHAPGQVEVSLKMASGNEERIYAAIEAQFQDLCSRLHGVPPAINFTPFHWTVGAQKLRRIEQRRYLYSQEAAQ